MKIYLSIIASDYAMLARLSIGIEYPMKKSSMNDRFWPKAADRKLLGKGLLFLLLH